MTIENVCVIPSRTKQATAATWCSHAAASGRARHIQAVTRMAVTLWHRVNIYLSIYHTEQRTSGTTRSLLGVIPEASNVRRCHSLGTQISSILLHLVVAVVAEFKKSLGARSAACRRCRSCHACSAAAARVQTHLSTKSLGARSAAAATHAAAAAAQIQTHLSTKSLGARSVSYMVRPTTKL